MIKHYNSNKNIGYIILLLLIFYSGYSQSQVIIGYSFGNYLGNSLSNIDCMAEEVSYEQGFTRPIKSHDWNRALKLGVALGGDEAKYVFAINPFVSHFYGEGVDTSTGINKRYDFKLYNTIVQFAGLDVGERNGPGFGFSFDLDMLKLKYKIGTEKNQDGIKYEKYYKGITVGYSLWGRVNPTEKISIMLTYSGVLLNTPIKGHSYYYRVSNLSLGLILMLG